MGKRKMGKRRMDEIWKYSGGPWINDHGLSHIQSIWRLLSASHPHNVANTTVWVPFYSPSFRIRTYTAIRPYIPLFRRSAGPGPQTLLVPSVYFIAYTRHTHYLSLSRMDYKWNFFPPRKYEWGTFSVSKWANFSEKKKLFPHPHNFFHPHSAFCWLEYLS